MISTVSQATLKKAPPPVTSGRHNQVSSSETKVMGGWREGGVQESSWDESCIRCVCAFGNTWPELRKTCLIAIQALPRVCWFQCFWDGDGGWLSVGSYVFTFDIRKSWCLQSAFLNCKWNSHVPFTTVRLFFFNLEISELNWNRNRLHFMVFIH